MKRFLYSVLVLFALITIMVSCHVEEKCPAYSQANESANSLYVINEE